MSVDEWAYCPTCGIERADYEGVRQHLDTCPNCGSESDPQLTIEGIATIKVPAKRR